MKTKIKKNKSLLYSTILTIILLPIQLFGQLAEAKMERTKTFAITKDVNIEIYNKYGDIQLIPWNKDSVKIEVFARATDKQMTKAEKLMSYVDFDMNGTAYYVIAKTLFKDYRGTVWGDISDIANSWMNVNNSLSINYQISLPDYCPIKINNKFGNVYISNHTGPTDIYISNGDFKANQLSGNNKIMIEFGNAKLNKFGKGSIYLSYGELNIQEAQKLSTETKSAKIYIEKCKELEINSRRDKITVDSLYSLKGNANFSYFLCGLVVDNINSKWQYGEIKVENMAEALRFINLNTNSTDVYITFSKTTSCNLNIKHRKTQIIYPSSITSLQKELVFKEKDIEDYRTFGTIGNNPNTATDIQIQSTLGSIHIDYR